MIELDIKLVQTKPIEAEAVEVRFDDWDYAKAITDWAHGKLHNGTSGTYLEVRHQVGLGEAIWARARTGDWIVKSGPRMADTEVLSEFEYRERFETRAFVVQQPGFHLPGEELGWRVPEDGGYNLDQKIEIMDAGISLDRPSRFGGDIVVEELPPTIRGQMDAMGAVEIDPSAIQRPADEDPFYDNDPDSRGGF